MSLGFLFKNKQKDLVLLVIIRTCVCVCAYAHMHVVQRTFRIVFLGSLKNVFGRDYNDSINSIWQYVHFNSIDSSNL